MSKGFSSYLLYTLIAVLVISLYVGDFTGLQKLQWKIDDIMYSFRGESNNASDIVLVNIDDRALEGYGDWPWSYAQLADVVAVINSAQPKSFLMNLDLASRVSEDTLGNTQILANQISWSDNVVLTYDIALAEYSHQRLSKPEYLFKSSILTESDLGILDEEAALNVRKPFLPSGLLCEYADGLGFGYMEYALDKRVREISLVANYDGFYYPSATLMTAALHLGYGPDDIKIIGSEAVRIGRQLIPTSESGRLLINYNKPGQTFPTYSVVDLLGEQVNLSNLKGKMVILSLAANGEGLTFQTPVSGKMPQGEVLANIMENLIHGNFVTHLNLSAGINILLILGMGILFAFLLPRVSVAYRFIVLMVTLIILGNLNYVLLSSYGLIPRFLYLGMEIILMMIAAPMLDESRVKKTSEFSLPAFLRFGREAEKQISVPIKPTAPPVRHLQDTGSEPDFQKTEILQEPVALANGGMTAVDANSTPPPPPPAFDPDQPLGVTASDRIEIDQAQNFNNLPQPDDDPLGMSPTVAHPISSAASDSIIVPAPQTDSLPPIEPPTVSPATLSLSDSDRIESLGRYKVLGVLGKGAMGTVYRGVDPAINRPVALKTIRLDFVSDEAELAELRDRLFREAQAAGKLSHPNIVTIYDVGSEGNLQYIAMEYLEGQALEDLIKKKVQFSYKIIANIIAQICDALEYAHNQGIIHRDVKPANIMILRDYTVKVMDFGIARVDSSSMTKTGIAMGTPNYIAPELLQGMDVDRRCDLFSLGVVIYEMLTGRRPFKGENMTALIYSIIHDTPTPPSNLNENIPMIFDHIVTNALKKKPSERYQKAADIKKPLYDFLGTFQKVRQ